MGDTWSMELWHWVLLGAVAQRQPWERSDFGGSSPAQGMPAAVSRVENKHGSIDLSAAEELLRRARSLFQSS